MKVERTTLDGVIVIEPRSFPDARGRFAELWHADRYANAGIRDAFVQDNVSVSQRGVIRGLHFQHPQPQGKLVTVLHGAAYDVVVDIRVGSPTFGRWLSFELTAESMREVYVPPGFAHGFQSLVDGTVLHYKCTALYAPEFERTLRWNDPRVNIEWPVQSPILSDKDARAGALDSFGTGALPTF